MTTRERQKRAGIVNGQSVVGGASFFERELQGVGPADEKRMLQVHEADMRAVLAEYDLAARWNEEAHSRARCFPDQLRAGSHGRFDTDQAIGLGHLIELHAQHSKRVRTRGAGPWMGNAQRAREVLAGPHGGNNQRSAQRQARPQYSASMTESIHGS